MSFVHLVLLCAGTEKEIFSDLFSPNCAPFECSCLPAVVSSRSSVSHVIFCRARFKPTPGVKGRQCLTFRGHAVPRLWAKGQVVIEGSELRPAQRP